MCPKPTTKADNKTAPEEAATVEGRFAYEGLDRSMHEKGRLAIMTSLVTHANGLLFGDLKKLTSLTDGNLSRHLEVLREAGLIEIWKGYEKKRPQTLCRITVVGRTKFGEYLQQLEQVIVDAREKQAEMEKAGGKMTKPQGDWIPA